MELSYDWINFQGMFYPHRRASGLQSTPTGPIYLITDEDQVLSAFAENEDLADWVGKSFKELSSKTHHRELIAFDRATVERSMTESLSLGNFYEQVEFLKKTPTVKGATDAKARVAAPKNCQRLGRRHFLLDGVQGWWSKVLPSNYGLYIRVEGKPGQDFLVVVRRGNFAGFQEPDLSTLNPERRKNAADVVKYLSERYMVPIQGIFVSPEDWAEWSRQPSPWKEVARGVRANRVRLVPFRWGLASLMASRAFLGL